jgi:DNA-binding response OmpR family regulator
MEERPERLLFIDDDNELCSLVGAFLETKGFEVELAYDGKEAIEKARSKEYSLLIIDVMLPGKHNGFDVLQTLRAESAVPIMMISGKSGDVDRIIGLEMGADDYLPKPFNMEELFARMRAILRRAGSIVKEVAMGERVLKCKKGDIDLNSGPRVVYRGKEPVELTAVEFELLKTLLRNAGQTVTRSELAKEVLKRTLAKEDRNIDIHISRLRKKIGERTCGGARIKSIRGAGYMYIDPAFGEVEIKGNVTRKAPKNRHQD